MIMKKRYVVCICLVVILSAFSFLVLQLSAVNSPPGLEEVQLIFDNNREDILLIASFLIDSGYDNIYISDSSGQVKADFVDLAISDDRVCHAIDHLLTEGTFIEISKLGGTISLLQWTGPRDIGCGVLYSANVEESIDQEWLTELTPLSEAHWFSYVSDYNAWRNGKRASLPG